MEVFLDALSNGAFEFRYNGAIIRTYDQFAKIKQNLMYSSIVNPRKFSLLISKVKS